MYIEKTKNNGIEYLRLVESVYAPNGKGCKKRIIKSIGPLSKFDDGKANYYERLKESFKQGNPLIESLKEFCSRDTTSHQHKVTFTAGEKTCVGDPKIFSHILIERILEELGLIELFRAYKNYDEINYDLLGFLRLLIYGRVLNPASKIATVEQANDYYNTILKQKYKYNVYDSLDFIYNRRKQIFNKVNKVMNSKFNRDTSIIFYDVTNFYFETERLDPDYEDENGNITKGLRKMGVSKEERKLPIVQMGLFMDNNGFPISIEAFPGNTLDKLTVKKALDESLDDMHFDKFIFVGDRGMCTYPNIMHIKGQGNGYIVSKSIQASKKEDKLWITNEDDYKVLTDGFKYKSRILTKKVKDEFGTIHEISEKEVVYWSERFYKRQIKENKSFLDFIDKLEQNPENFRLSSAQSKDIKKFLKKDCLNDETGEILDSNKIKMYIDKDKVNAYKAQFGYYLIITSELEMDDIEVINKYHGLSQIEDQFRVMKSSLETRPVHVRTEEHIKAHLIICFIALLVTRVIQYKIKNSPTFKANNDRNWEQGMTPKRIIDALNKWTVDLLPGNLYRFNNINKGDLSSLLDYLDIKIPLDLFSKSDLKMIKMKIKI